MTTVRDLFPSKYICADDLHGQDRILTIAAVVKELMYDRKERQEVLKPVVYFAKAKKGLVLNITTARIIEKLHGKIVDDWKDKRLILYPTEELSYGEMKDVVRVRHYLPKPAPAPGPALSIAEGDPAPSTEESQP